MSLWHTHIVISNLSNRVPICNSTSNRGMILDANSLFEMLVISDDRESSSSDVGPRMRFAGAVEEGRGWSRRRGDEAISVSFRRRESMPWRKTRRRLFFASSKGNSPCSKSQIFTGQTRFVLAHRTPRSSEPTPASQIEPVTRTRPSENMPLELNPVRFPKAMIVANSEENKGV